MRVGDKVGEGQRVKGHGNSEIPVDLWPSVVHVAEAYSMASRLLTEEVCSLRSPVTSIWKQ